ncbi:MAG: hypothetical protein ABSG71_20990 [Thermodesulfobacteriota bacterium]|jgi:hypothetical protein
MVTMDMIVSLIEKLTGQQVPFLQNIEKLKAHDPFAHGGIGYNQFNEILLTLGYDRVTVAFFRYLFDRESGESKIISYEEFQEGIQKFRKLAMLLFGNIKYAFKTLSGFDQIDLDHALEKVSPISSQAFESRADPIHEIKQISGEEAYYLGYIVESEIENKLKSDPENPILISEKKKLENVRSSGKDNHDAYLTYDHMDVYIATSMRERHEFFMVNGFIKELFGHELIKPLELRWFDPTQVYCDDRIDKGLVEGLMLKRSKCTIYHIQETDTLGKDCELAATLAQGKPVIAYVPKLVNPDSFKTEARLLFKQLYYDKTIEDLIRYLLPRYYPEGAWKDNTVRAWLSGTQPVDVNQALDLLYQKAQDLYEVRAKTLCESHPLALQVNLSTGVANGVLVVRTVNDCAKLLRKIILNTMEFDIEETRVGKRITLLLRERISGCVFRVVTGDELLTNTFWNFYLEES